MEVHQITVEFLDGEVFEVTVTDDRSTTTHRVIADPVEIERLGSGVSAEEVIGASFRFLLDREPKESILRQFDLTVISSYFPEYDHRIGDYL